METLATVGAWILSEGSSNAAMVVITPEQRVEPPPERHTWTVYEQESADHLFAAQVKPEETNLAQALLVTTIGMATLKGVVLDESREDEVAAEAEAKKRRLKMEHQHHGCC
jgi:hypothetical protein